MLHASGKYGLDAAETEFRTKYDKHARTSGQPSFKFVVRGKIEFVGSIRGKLDPLYWRLLRAYARLDPNCKLIEPPGFVEYDMDELKKGIVVLTDLSTFMQSSAFYLAGVGLVTCSHAISDPAQLVITEAKDPLDTQTPVDLVAKDNQADLAILKPQLLPKKWLAVGDEDQLKQFDGVMLCGFQNTTPVQMFLSAKGNSFTSTGSQGCDGSIFQPPFWRGIVEGPSSIPRIKSSELQCKARHKISIALSPSVRSSSSP